MSMHWTLPIVFYVLALGAAIFLMLPTTRWRVLGTAVYICATAALGVGSIYLLGQPKPLSLEFDVSGSQVIAFYPDEPKAIYLWVLRDGVPKTLVLPWSNDEAQSVQDQFRLMLMGEAGDVVMSGDPGEGQTVTKTLPPRPLPPKDAQ